MSSKIQKFHLGIYGVIEEGDRILLIKKARGPYRGMWDLPGGRPVHGETILQTLEREVEEETGVRVIEAEPYLNEAFVVEYQEGNDVISFHHTCLIYKIIKFDTSEFRADIHEEDAAGCAWIKKDQLVRSSLSRVVLAII